MLYAFRALTSILSQQMAEAMVSLTPFMVVVTALRVDGDP